MKRTVFFFTLLFMCVCSISAQKTTEQLPPDSFSLDLQKKLSAISTVYDLFSFLARYGASYADFDSLLIVLNGADEPEVTTKEIVDNTYTGDSLNLNAAYLYLLARNCRAPNTVGKGVTDTSFRMLSEFFANCKILTNGDSMIIHQSTTVRHFMWISVFAGKKSVQKTESFKNSTRDIARNLRYAVNEPDSGAGKNINIHMYQVRGGYRIPSDLKVVGDMCEDQLYSYVNSQVFGDIVFLRIGKRMFWLDFEP